MADDSGKYTALELLAYVGDVTANVECPFCRNATWAYPTKDGHPRILWVDYSTPEQAFTVPALALTCEKCGFIRQHDIAMITTILDKQNG